MLLECIELQTTDSPAFSLIVLHGLGADGNDFVPVAQELDLSTLGGARFIFPHAPMRPVTINNGYVMRAWYDIAGTPSARSEDEAGLRQSQAEIEALIRRERERGVPAHRIVLMGFSQGCAVALLTGLRHAERLGALVALSGYLPLAHKTQAERSDANTLVPIFMAHGRDDPMITLDRATASRDALRSLGYAVDWHQYAMPHSVCGEEIEDLNRWLLRVLG
jgi:phospholipase/carboxylesterase